MSKVICDICGTTYPGSTECCPICGCTNADAADLLGSESSYETFQEETVEKPANSRKKEIFNFDEVNQEEDPQQEDAASDYDDEEEEEDAPRHNAFVVILLTVLIVVLLGAAAFIYWRYFLPNMREETPVNTEAVEMETQTTAATEPTVPCLQMGMLNASIAELNAEGQQFLLHIKAFPEDTTDKIIYTSADESIATVTEDGKITAVSEGETTIYISCGKVSMDCPVIVKYVEETVPPTTEAAVEETNPQEQPQETESKDASEETEPENASEETEPSAAPTENKNLKDVKLKLKKIDIQLGVYYEYQLLLDCALEQDEVTWSSEHPHIAKVDEKGNVTAVKEGTTSIIAKYGDQEVQCIVRCVWY